MDEHDTAEVDDEFERLGRLAGAELRQPPPAEGAGAVLRSAHRRRSTTAVVAVGVTVAVVATGLFVATSRFQDETAPVATQPPSPVPVTTAPSTSVPVQVETAPSTSAPAVVTTVPSTSAPAVVTAGPFVGIWVPIDTDGSSQTMEITASGGNDYEFVRRDDFAAECSGAPATMTGRGGLVTDQQSVTDEQLVFARAELTCDDGTVPSIGLAPQAELADLYFHLDPAGDQVIDPFQVAWQRADPNEASATSKLSPSGKMWPQSTLEEVQAAQRLAIAGDPDYSWQLEPELVNNYDVEVPGDVELVDRFLRQVLGWEGYIWRGSAAGTARSGLYTDLDDQQYLRCAAGRTNPLYPPGAEPQRGELCAPTIDDLTYETVRLDLIQPAGRGRDGIWVVNDWDPATPFAQADPAVVEAEARERLEEFLAARVAGDGADGLVEVLDDTDVPLLYATTSGSPYERYEIETVGRPQWPWAVTVFSVRLFADGGTTVVEQRFRWIPGRGLSLGDHPTTENDEPVAVTFTSADGELTVSATDRWDVWLPGKGAGEGGHEQALDVWFGAMWHREEFFGSGERIEFVDPVAYDAWCADNGGSPLLTAPADAASIAQQVIDDPNFDATAPMPASIGGVEAVSIDVTMAPGGQACGIGMIEISRWVHTIGWDPGWRLRLYLVDLPEGMSVETLAIAVVAPEDRFDDVIAQTAPIIDSIEFHPG
jgi:hypothetical protein